MKENIEIVISNLSKSFGNTEVLKNIDLTIKEGMFGLLGPNGAGKTTLMRIITSLIKPTKGTVSICGVPTTNGTGVRELIGYLPQDFSMYPSMTAYEALDYLAILSGLTTKERKELVPETLKKVNLLKNKNTKVKAMSGGMKRRLGIAQAIIHNPRVLVVDEPTAGLDPEERVRFRNLLCEIARDRIVILSTHIVGDIEATCENIAIMNRGEIFYQGTVSDMLREISKKTYSATIPATDIDKIKNQYLVTSIKISGNSMNVKIVSEEKPFENAVLCEADVEDAYLYKMHCLDREGK